MKFLIFTFCVFTILIIGCEKPDSATESLEGQLISPVVVVNQTKGSSYLQNKKMDKVNTLKVTY